MRLIALKLQNYDQSERLAWNLTQHLPRCCKCWRFEACGKIYLSKSTKIRENTECFASFHFALQTILPHLGSLSTDFRNCAWSHFDAIKFSNFFYNRIQFFNMYINDRGQLHTNSSWPMASSFTGLYLVLHICICGTF